MKRLLAWMSGLTAVGILQGLFFFPFEGKAPVGVDILAICSFGNLVFALVSGLIIGLALRVFSVQPPKEGTLFWLGASLGLIVALGSLSLGSAPVIAVLVSAIVAGLSSRLGRIWLPSTNLATLVLCFASSSFIWGWFHQNTRVLVFDYEKSLETVSLAEPGAIVSESLPDVVLISVDTLRADSIVGGGPARAVTPHLDKMRSEGAWSKWGLSSSNQTLPGHVGLLTGTTALQHGVTSNQDMVPTQLELVSEVAQREGYKTVGIVTNGLLSASAGFGKGWDIYNDYRVRFAGSAQLLDGRARRHTLFGLLSGFISKPMTSNLFRKTILSDFSKSEHSSPINQSSNYVVEGFKIVHKSLSKQSRPVFYFLHMMDPHAPYPKELKNPQGKKLPHRYATNENLINTSTLKMIEKDLHSTDSAIKAEAQEAVEFCRAAYIQEVEGVDEAVGRILTTAKRAGRPVRICFTSDHGEHFGEGGFLEHANTLLEPLLRVPFVLWGAGVPSGEIPPTHLSQVLSCLFDPSLATTPKEHLARWENQIAWRDETGKWIVDLESSEKTDNSLPPALVSVIRDLRRTVTTKSEKPKVTAEKAALLDALGYGDSEK
ncbi:MAG: sulfatase-like hydrolase/transferase [Planctomycetota bacterium]|jgi:arylsulfatase A-like enzyme|nr:sulfatase-like hydrolase/transferase [Planctomycetota bacterium]